MTAHRYWRIYMTEVSNPGSIPRMAEIELRASIGGATLITSGTMLSASSSNGSLPPSRLADGSNSTDWAAANATLPAWIKCDFGVGNEQDVVELGIRPSATMSPPRDFELQWSDDDSSWTTTLTIKAYCDWAFNTWSAFSSSRNYEAAANGAAWRIYCTANGGHSLVSFAEIEMRATAGGADQCTGGYAVASAQNSVSYPASYAFNNVTSQAHRADAADLPVWVGYVFPSSVDVRELYFAAWSGLTESPADFALEKWDGSQWVEVYSWAGLTWGSGENKTLTVIGAAAARPVVFVCT